MFGVEIKIIQITREAFWYLSFEHTVLVWSPHRQLYCRYWNNCKAYTIIEFIQKQLESK